MGRQLPAIVPLTKPSRIDKARKMGYKRKKGYLVYRVRVRRGNNNKNIPRGKIQGKPSTQGVSQIKPKRNLRVVAEGRVGQKCGGLRVMNSYWVNQDSTYKYFEKIRDDPRINWICDPTQAHREKHGLTSAGRSAKGISGKGHLYAKARPSKHASMKRRQLKNFKKKDKHKKFF